MRLGTNKKKAHQSPVTSHRHSYNKLVLWCSGVLVLFLFLFIFLTHHPQVEIKIKDGGYQLFADGKPYFIKGVCYNPAPIGEGYEYDLGEDKAEPWISDGKLMQEAGINTIRLYRTSNNPEGLKKAIKYLYEKHGIKTALGHWLGFWEYPQPAYADPEFRNKVKKEVLDMVRAYKDEQGILFWILGNENNYSFSCRINQWACPEADKAEIYERANIRAKIYYTFVNEIAREIHKIDPNHPVVLGNGELGFLDIAARYSPDIDVVGVLMYRGKTFGNTFNGLKKIFDKPLVLIEFGADSFNSFKKEVDEEMQSFFLEAQWKEIIKNSVFGKGGAGNSLGGFIFEWSDEWWKHNMDNPENWKIHDSEAGWSQGAYYFDNKAEQNLNMNEEWFGLVGISEALDAGINKRTPRKAYYMLKELWH